MSKLIFLSSLLIVQGLKISGANYNRQLVGDGFVQPDITMPKHMTKTHANGKPCPKKNPKVPKKDPTPPKKVPEPKVPKKDAPLDKDEKLKDSGITNKDAKVGDANKAGSDLKDSGITNNLAKKGGADTVSTHSENPATAGLPAGDSSALAGNGPLLFSGSTTGLSFLWVLIASM